jgi:stage II sporulation protein D
MYIENEPIIRVGLLAAKTVEFELNDEFFFDTIKFIPGIYTASCQNGIIQLKYQSNHLFVNNKFEFIPANLSSTFILKDVTIGIGFHWEKQENQEFKGGIILQVEKDLIRVINTVPLESYLCSVISSEMSAMNDINLLSAHAIVSRSWLLAQIQNRGKGLSNKTIESESGSERNSFGYFNQSEKKFHEEEIIKWYDREDHEEFDVCADDHCQRYQGITKVISENAVKAIEATRGKVLIFNNEICDARFSKCCGGITEDFENIWQSVKVPYLVAIRDIESKMFPKVAHYGNDQFILSEPEAFCNTSDPEILSQVLVDFDRTTTNFYRWNVEYDQEELSSLISRKSGIDFGEIKDMIPIERGNSGRIIRLKIVGTKRVLIVGKELEIRKWLSESHLYSSAFIVEKCFEKGNYVPSKFTLRGAGWGHGAGMCQIGAAVMSQKGYSVNQILEHYYYGATLQKIY